MGKTVIKSDKTLLWTNPSPTATFGPQTITLDLSKYKEVEIIFRHDNSADLQMRSQVNVGAEGAVTNARPDSFLSQERHFTVSLTGITFDDCKIGANAEIYNNHSIPTHIYGIK